jgi:hypothetical protein
VEENDVALDKKSRVSKPMYENNTNFSAVRSNGGFYDFDPSFDRFFGDVDISIPRE